MSSQVVPHAPAVERRVLAGCLHDPELLHEAVSGLKTADFYVDGYRKVFEVLQRLSRQPGASQDPVLVRQACGTNEDLLAALDEVMFDASWFNSDGTAACCHLRDLTTMRRFYEVSLKTAAAALEGAKDPVGYLDKATEKLVAAIQSRQSSTKVASISEVLRDFVNDLTKPETFTEETVSTGFRGVDAILGGGWERGRMYVPAGRPGMGKTAFMMQCVAHAASKGKRCAVFSVEMPEKMLTKRLVATMSGVDSRAMKPGVLKPDQMTRLLKAADRISELPVLFPDSSTMTIEELVRTCRRLKVDGGLDLVAVDYLQLITTGNKSDSREQEVGSISRQLKRLARSLNIPVIALSQLSREVEKRNDKRPMMSDLRESGAIEQDADAILFLYRQDYYQRDKHNGECEVIVAKNRDGETGFVSLQFDAEHTRFSDKGQY